jgi:hypothetical protein
MVNLWRSKLCIKTKEVLHFSWYIKNENLNIITMNKNYALICCLIIGLLCISYNTYAGKKKKKKATNWSTFDFSEYVNGKIPGPVRKKYAATKRVYIADVVINQQVYSKYSKTSYGGLSHGSSHARMEANLGGIDFDTYQNAVAVLYDEIANFYKNQGYEIVSEDEVIQTELFMENEANKRIVAANASDVDPVRYGDGGLNKYVSVRPANKLVVYNDAKKDFMTKGSAPWKVYFKLANELNALVVSYKFNTTFVVMGGKGGYFNTSVSVSASPHLSVSSGSLTTLAPSRKKTQPTTGSYYQTDVIEGNNNGWITPEGFKSVDESKSSYYWTGSSSSRVENVLMVVPELFVDEVLTITGGLSEALTTEFIGGINK